MDSRNIVLQLAREKAEATLDPGLLSTFTFNDTIVFALESNDEQLTIQEAEGFFLLLRKFMLDSLRNGILFRGAISAGTFYADKNTNTVMGEAVTDSASWYAKASWIGIHATPRATFILNSLLEKENKRPTYVMIDYLVPIKGGPPILLKAVNWPKAVFLPNLATRDVTDAPRATVLSWLARQPLPFGTEDKCFNTMLFFDKVVAKQKLTTRSRRS